MISFNFVEIKILYENFLEYLHLNFHVNEVPRVFHNQNVILFHKLATSRNHCKINIMLQCNERLKSAESATIDKNQLVPLICRSHPLKILLNNYRNVLCTYVNVVTCNYRSRAIVIAKTCR